MFVRPRTSQADTIFACYSMQSTRRPTQQQWLQLAEQFLAEHGRLPSATHAGEMYGGANLGNWCVQQRIKYRKGELDKELAEGLGAIPGWSWQVRG